MDYKQEYVNFLSKHLKINRPLKVVFDASNGPTGSIVRDLFASTNVEAIVINDTIDPDFKSHGPNPLLPHASDECKRVILEHKADLGVMFDADGDRAFFLDDKGEMIPACFVSGLMFKVFPPPYVLDELVYQSAKLLKLTSDQNMIPSRIGAYFIKQELRERGLSFGAEYSGHYYFKDFFNADSGIFATVLFLNAFSAQEQSLSGWCAAFGSHVIDTQEFHVDSLDEVPHMYKEIETKYEKQAKEVVKRDGITLVFDDVWVNIRSSNTEPIVRIICGGSKMEVSRLSGEMRGFLASIFNLK